MFTPSVWAGLTADRCQEKTNSCESFHSHFSSEFYYSHPPIFTFVRVLLNIQIDNYIKMRSCAKPRNKNKNTVWKYELIQQEFLKFERDSRYRFDFVKKVSSFNKQRNIH